MVAPGREVTAPSARRLRIVHAVRSDGFAGVERYVATVSAALDRRGHQVVVIGGDAAAMRDAISSTSVAVHEGRRTYDVGRALARHARTADVVHVHMTAAEVAAVMAWPFVRAAAVTTRHFAQSRGSTRVARGLAPIVRRRFAAQLAISRFVAASVGEPSEVVRNAVAPAAAVDPAGQVVLVAQRLESEKRTGDALAAWRAAGLGARGWELWLAGEGAQRTELEAQAIAWGLCGVRFLGHRADLAELRRHTGIALATAPAEPFGLSVAEAMAQGLPVVAAAGGGHLETVGTCRPDLLYPPGDVPACAARLRMLADDVAARRRAGRDLRACQQKTFALDRHVDELLAVYERVAVP